VRELARGLGEPGGSLDRILGDLRELGLVEPGGKSGTYRLGLRLFHLGGLGSSRFQNERDAAWPTNGSAAQGNRPDGLSLCETRRRGALVSSGLMGSWSRKCC
jgi:hypothetical protein